MAAAPTDESGGFSIEQTRTQLVLRLDGEVVGTLDWRLGDATMHIDYVQVDPARRGRGLGVRLVRAAVDEARAKGRRVIPVCGYAARVLPSLI